MLRNLVLLGRQHLGLRAPLQHARFLSKEFVAGRPEGIEKFLHRERIEKPTLILAKALPIAMQNLNLVGIAGVNLQQVRCFHAKGSKVRYLDFRYRFGTNHLRSHLLIIRRQKMKKHRRKKWRKKFKSVIAKMRLKREIAKEKNFRVELLTMIKRAEQFDPREYALRKIREINNRPKEQSPDERLEQLKELMRKNRYQVDYIKPKHRRADSY
jgi:hypothetical protein